MIHNSPLADVSSKSTGIFDAAGFSQHSNGEPYINGKLKAEWKFLTDYLSKLGLDGLKERQLRATRMRHDDGATYNPFDNSGEGAGCWSLDTLPLVMTAKEWRQLETGLVQRAAILEKIVADVYGPQKLLKEGIIPPELIYANPGFQRDCHKMEPAGGRYLNLFAFDLYRDSTGKFRVFRDHGSFPAGLGYILENRIITSRIFSDLYQKVDICRLANFFHTVQQGLQKNLSLTPTDSAIVILSPGQESPFYFEYALLSRYLGYPLVESQDLTVRDSKVYQKKLAGLERVEIIIRYLHDEQLDPFSMQTGSNLGVAGLFQAVREKNIIIINSPGSSFIDTPALGTFMPQICRTIMGEDLLIAPHPARWCGRKEDKNFVTAHRELFDLTNGLVSHHLAAREPIDIFSKQSHECLAREVLDSTVVPSLTPNGIRPGYALYRFFGCATEYGFSFMPGALVISSHDRSTLVSGSADNQMSKDLWVISDSPVEPFSLIEGMKTVVDIKRSGDLASRTADNFLWLGRYLERAEDAIRLIRAIYHRLTSETRPENSPELPFLLNLLRMRGMLPPAANEDKVLRPVSTLVVQLNDALFRKEFNTSVVNTLIAVQNSARRVRDRLSQDCWKSIKRLDDFIVRGNIDTLDLLDQTLYNLNSFSGLAMESITRSLAWRFMDMGRRIERALNHVELIDIGLHRRCSSTSNALEALLEVADSIITYRSRYRTRFMIEPVLDLLLVDETNPKSLGFQLAQLSEHIEHLPRSTDQKFKTPEEKAILAMLTSVRLLDLGTTWKEGEEEIELEPMYAFLDTIREQLLDFTQSITEHYLSRIPATSHFATLHNK